MSTNLLQMSDRSQHCRFLAVHDQQNQMSSLKVRISGDLSAGKSSLCWAGLIAGEKYCYFTV